MSQPADFNKSTASIVDASENFISENISCDACSLRFVSPICDPVSVPGVVRLVSPVSEGYLVPPPSCGPSVAPLPPAGLDRVGFYSVGLIFPVLWLPLVRRWGFLPPRFVFSSRRLARSFLVLGRFLVLLLRVLFVRVLPRVAWVWPLRLRLFRVGPRLWLVWSSLRRARFQSGVLALGGFVRWVPSLRVSLRFGWSLWRWFRVARFRLWWFRVVRLRCLRALLPWVPDPVMRFRPALFLRVWCSLRPVKDGWTPLHLAVQSHRTDIIRLLLIKGADKSLKNRLPKLAGHSDYV
ncbi:hypothetical protein OROGR_019353 [Orobanche gracilis]